MPREKIANREMLPPGEKYSLYSETGCRCAHCGKHLRYGESTLDHIIPISKGGEHTRRNWTILCEDCNKSKYNHVIAPTEYYTYLPKNKLDQAQAMFEAYIQSGDWLSWENLFQTDRFELSAKHAVINPKSQKLFTAPMRIKIRKMVPTEAYDWLQLYRAHLRVADRDLVISDPREIEHPFYEITQNGNPIAVFECFMCLETGIDPNNPEEELPEVDLNFFTHWDLKYHPRVSDYTMFYIVKALVEEIRRTLENSAHNSIVGLSFKSVAGDRHIPHMLEILPPQYMHRFEQRNFEGADPDAKILGFSSILFQGTNADLRAIMAQRGAKNEDELVTRADRSSMAKPILDSLSAQSEEIKPDRIVYREMNRSYTKEHKKKRKRRP